MFALNLTTHSNDLCSNRFNIHASLPGRFDLVSFRIFMNSIIFIAALLL